ncbi:MAG: NAD-dependent epimerase/dehydratase family protein [Acidobacteria bacterium]|nr:NAD-dependent epimerase/dehydratase family protein [Acidobacteriota bacterium]
MPESVLVTGGAGFVGAALALRVKRAYPDATVTAFDNLRRRGSELNLPRLKAGGVRFVHGDIRSLEDLADVRPEPDLILECSAEPSVLAGYGASPEYLIRTNLNGCFHCLEIARRTKADFLFVSTSRVYPVALVNALECGETDTRFTLRAEQSIPGASQHGISEKFPLEGARSLYGMTKLAAELMVAEYGDAYGIRFVIDRCGLLTGPWQMAKSDQGVIALWVAAHCLGRGLKYIGFGGSGKQVRDFLHIDDFADLVLDQVANIKAYAGRAWNVGGGTANSVSLREATALCREVTGKAIEVAASGETRPSDLKLFITDHRAVSAVRAWRPKRDARQTFADIAAWIESQGAPLREILLG